MSGRVRADDVCAALGIALGHHGTQQPITPAPADGATAVAALRLALPQAPSGASLAHALSSGTYPKQR